MFRKWETTGNKVCLWDRLISTGKCNVCRQTTCLWRESPAENATPGCRQGRDCTSTWLPKRYRAAGLPLFSPVAHDIANACTA